MRCFLFCAINCSLSSSSSLFFHLYQIPPPSVRRSFHHLAVVYPSRLSALNLTRPIIHYEILAFTHHIRLHVFPSCHSPSPCHSACQFVKHLTRPPVFSPQVDCPVLTKCCQMCHYASLFLNVWHKLPLKWLKILKRGFSHTKNQRLRISYGTNKTTEPENNARHQLQIHVTVECL